MRLYFRPVYGIIYSFKWSMAHPTPGAFRMWLCLWCLWGIPNPSDVIAPWNGSIFDMLLRGIHPVAGARQPLQELSNIVQLYYTMYHLVMTNIAMERFTIFNRWTICKWTIYTMAMLNNQRVSTCYPLTLTPSSGLFSHPQNIPSQSQPSRAVELLHAIKAQGLTYDLGQPTSDSFVKPRKTPPLGEDSPGLQLDLLVFGGKESLKPVIKQVSFNII